MQVSVSLVVKCLSYSFKAAKSKYRTKSVNRNLYRLSCKTELKELPVMLGWSHSFRTLRYIW